MFDVRASGRALDRAGLSSKLLVHPRIVCMRFRQ